jgi:hypothetical protein
MVWHWVGFMIVRFTLSKNSIWGYCMAVREGSRWQILIHNILLSLLLETRLIQYIYPLLLNAGS